MNITKLTENFSLIESTDAFEMNGNITRESNGNLNVYFTMARPGGDVVGDCHYNKYGENTNVNFGVNCPEANRDEVTAYADTVIDSVLEYLKGNN